MLKQDLSHGKYVSYLQNQLIHNLYSGTQAAEALCIKVDYHIHALFTQHFPEYLQNSVTLIAIGGFGTNYLSPFSDIDLCIIISSCDKKLENNIRDFFYRLWDSGFKLGHTVGTLQQIIDLCHQDIYFRTSFINHRFIQGSVTIYQKILSQYTQLQYKTTQSFIAAKILEREKRIKKQNQQFINIKNGTGGLRDIQTIQWLSRYIFYTIYPYKILKQNDIHVLKYAHNFIWKIRFLNHNLCNTASDIIYDKNLNKLALMLNYKDSELFQKDCQKNMGNISVITDKFLTHLKLLSK